jgi:hypothetical protein
MFAASSYSANRLWLAKCALLVEGAAMSVVDQTMFQDKCVVAFTGWLLMQVSGIGNAGKRQMFYLTFIAQYYGLSRDGIELVSTHGYGVTLDMFDSYRRMYKNRSAALTRYTP